MRQFLLFLFSFSISSCGWINEKWNSSLKSPVTGSQNSSLRLLVQPTNQVLWYKSEAGFYVGDPGVSQLIDDTSTKESTVSQTIASNQPRLVKFSPMGDKTSFYFDGNDFLTVPNSADLNTVAFDAKSMSLAFRTTDDVTSRQYIWEQGNSTTGLSVYIFEGRIYFGAWRALGTQLSMYLSAPIKANESYTFSWVFNFPKKECVAYLNGARFATAPLGLYNMAAHAFDITVGNSQSTRTETGTDPRFTVGFKGYLAELNVFKVALTDAEVLEQHQYLAAKWLGFSPKSLSGLSFWYSTPRLDLIVGAPSVSQWKDAGPLLYDTLPQADINARPSLETVAINSLPALSFGTTKYLEILNKADIGFTSYSNRTFSVVFQTGTDITTHQLIYEQGDQKSGLSVSIRNRQLLLGIWNGSYHTIFLSAYLAPNRTFLASYVLNSETGGFSGLINGRSFATQRVASTQLAETQNPVLGASNGTLSPDRLPITGSGFTGKIAEVLSYSRALSFEESARLHDYLLARWAIDTTLVPIPPDVVASTNQDQKSGLEVNDDFFEEQLKTPPPTLEEEYGKVDDLGIDPNAKGTTDSSTSTDSAEIDLDEPSAAAPLCLADSAGSAGGSQTGGTSASPTNGTIVLSPDTIPVSNEGELFERIAELEFFTQLGDNPDTTINTTNAELDTYGKNLESARIELFLAYMRSYANTSNTIQKCKYITKASQMLGPDKKLRST